MRIEDTKDLSSYIKFLRKKRKIKVRDLAIAIPITVQGLSNWLNSRKSVDWKINSLIEISKILSFELKISNGKIYVKELEEKVKEYKEISLNNTSDFNYEVYEKYSDYSVITLYTEKDNINYCDEEDITVSSYDFIYNNEQEYIDEGYNRDNLIKVYGLLKNDTCCIVEDIPYEIQPEKIREYYYTKYAEPIEVGEDGLKIVYASKEYDYKIARVWAKIEILKDYDIRVLEYSALKPENTFRWCEGLGLMNYADKQTNKIYYFTQNIYPIYEKLNLLNRVKWRYFDINMNEIESGIILEKVYNDEEYGYYEEIYPAEKYYKVGDRIDVKLIRDTKYVLGRLGFEHECLGKKLDIPLNSIYLPDWKIQKS